MRKIALALLLTMASCVVAAQQPGKTYHLAWLGLAPSTSGCYDPTTNWWVRDFNRILADAGFIWKANLKLHLRCHATIEQADERARELVDRNPDVILTVGIDAAHAAKRATSTIPIVATFVPDMVVWGLVDSTARPGGNLTGTNSITTNLYAKQIELVRDLFPAAGAVGVFGNLAQHDAVIDPRGSSFRDVVLGDIRSAAGRLGMRAQVYDVREERQIQPSLKQALDAGVGAVLFLDDAFNWQHLQQTIASALALSLPAIYPHEIQVQVGGLISYGTNTTENFTRAAPYVVKVLRGAKPAELPIEEPTRLELVINLETARALGITIPPLLLARADRVIE